MIYQLIAAIQTMLAVKKGHGAGLVRSRAYPGTKRLASTFAWPINESSSHSKRWSPLGSAIARNGRWLATMTILQSTQMRSNRCMISSNTVEYSSGMHCVRNPSWCYCHGGLPRRTWQARCVLTHVLFPAHTGTIPTSNSNTTK
jgi:hypothetical protein